MGRGHIPSLGPHLFVKPEMLPVLSTPGSIYETVTEYLQGPVVSAHEQKVIGKIKMASLPNYFLLSERNTTFFLGGGVLHFRAFSRSSRKGCFKMFPLKSEDCMYIFNFFSTSKRKHAVPPKCVEIL